MPISWISWLQLTLYLTSLSDSVTALGSHSRQASPHSVWPRSLGSHPRHISPHSVWPSYSAGLPFTSSLTSLRMTQLGLLAPTCSRTTLILPSVGGSSPSASPFSLNWPTMRNPGAGASTLPARVGRPWGGYLGHTSGWTCTVVSWKMSSWCSRLPLRNRYLGREGGNGLCWITARCREFTWPSWVKIVYVE